MVNPRIIPFQVSRTMAPLRAVSSSAAALSTSTPRRAATPVETITAVGVARPMAQGQATRSTYRGQKHGKRWGDDM